VSDPRNELLGDTYGFMVTQAIGTVARAGIADLVAAGRGTIAELAAETSLPADSLRRLLRALAALEIFSLDGDDVRNTPKSEFLRADVPGSVSWIAQSFANEHFTVWTGAESSFRTGTAATPEVLGSGYFEWLGDHPAEAAIFNRAMAAGSAVRIRSLEQLDWSDELIVDVGGGTGTLLSSLLAGHPRLRGIVFDLPHAQESALATFETAGVADRASFASGDFFESVPAGGDVYVLSHILHDWDYEHALRILRACRVAAGEGARLLILDVVLPADGPGAAVPNLLDLHMLVLIGGRERTAEDWRRLLSQGGFTLERIHADGPVSVIEARTSAHGTEKT
jgi:hypothetical protein